MPGNPKPVVAPGSYKINVASLRVDSSNKGIISNQKYGVEATFTNHTPTRPSDQKVQDFTFKDPSTGRTVTGSYDFSWGNKDVNGFIIGDGSGGYYIITSDTPGSSSSTVDGRALLDPSKAQYYYFYDSRQPWSSGNYFTLMLSGKGYRFRQDNNGTATDGSSAFGGEQFTFDTCFLAGSFIKTPTGYRTIEELKSGDEILTYDPIKDQTVPQVVTWAGRSRINVNPALPMDMAGYPVRIRRNALANDIPSRDLLVTAEHCLFFDGRFVPARMMVNGRSIHFETSDARYQTAYDIFHVETEKHSIIIAHDVLTESYLDTGNRRQFMQATSEEDGNVTKHDFSSKNLSWQTDAAAPLCTDQAFTAPLFHDLLKRAEDLLFPVQHPYKTEAFSDDPEFHLITDKGQILHEKRSSDGYRLFATPADAHHVVLTSRTGRPYDVHGPFMDDRRLLGVLIGEIVFFRNGRSVTIDTHLTAPQLDGWFDLEPIPMRWTQGAAMLPLPSRQHDEDGLDDGLLAIKVMAGGPYPIETTPSPTSGHETARQFMFNNVG